jgi:kynurenine formamidase
MGKQFVDLTHSFDSTTPIWSGFRPSEDDAAADPKTHKPYTIKDDGFRATLYEMVGQYGTMSIRRRISTKTESAWTRSRSSR